MDRGNHNGIPISICCTTHIYENFEKHTIKYFPLTPTLWKRYIAHIKLNHPHGRKILYRLCIYLNNECESIKFMMEVEQDNNMPFLDVLITKKEYGSLANHVYKKKL